VASQKNVNGTVRCRVYKGTFTVLGRSSDTEKLYDASESSMDEIGAFSPEDTTGFISVQGMLSFPFRLDNWRTRETPNFPQPSKSSDAYPPFSNIHLSPAPILIQYVHTNTKSPP